MSLWNRGKWVVVKQCAAKATFSSLWNHYGESSEEGTIVIEQNDKTQKFRAYFEDTRGKRNSVSVPYAQRFVERYGEAVKE